MSVATVLRLHDMDLLLRELSDAASVARLRKLGYTLGDLNGLARTRERLVAGVDRRWVQHYLRALKRYGRGVVPVRERVCLGCFVTLPTSATPGSEESLTLCASCGRILFWR